MRTMIKARANKLQVLIVGLLLSLILGVSSCVSRERRQLDAVELMLESNPAKADTMLSEMPIPSGKQERAWYAVLKTQAQYKQYKPITSDSLILTATDYYETHRKTYHAALAWYTQGCVYKDLNNDVLAINAFLKAKDLFPDTLVRYYALVEQNLGRSYLAKGLYEESYNSFLLCRNNACRIQDSTMMAYADYNLALIKLHNNCFDGLNKSFGELLANRYLSDFYKGESLLQLAKYHIYSSCHYDSANYYLDKLIKNNTVSLGASYNLKGEINYLLGRQDSAYYYYKLSLSQKNDIYTLCDSYRRLCELSLLYDTNLEAFNYSTLYTESMDSIRVLRNANDVAKIEISHRLEIERLKRKEFHVRTIIISSTFLFALFIVILLVYQSYINRVNANYIKFCDNVWTKINTEITTNSTDKDCFLIGKAKYMNSPSHNLLIEKSNNHKYIRTEKEAVKHDLNVAFSDLIVRMLNEYPTINNKELQSCILSAIGIEKHIICQILDITDENYRTIKSRLKDKLGPSFGLFFE